MSYTDYCAGFRDGFRTGLNVGVRAGYEIGLSKGYVGGYIDGYRDCSLGLPCQPTLRLAEYKTTPVDFFSPPKFDPAPMPKYEFTLPKIDPIPMPKYDQFQPKYYDPLKVQYNNPIDSMRRERGPFSF
jgi:hypothetical protein